MTLAEALRVNGKARRKLFPKDVYMKISEDGHDFVSCSGNHYESTVHIHPTNALADDWEPYKRAMRA